MASKNKNLHRAKRAKSDEFYTQLSDIEAELRHYRNHFRDKVIFCNADDPYESNFFKYFALNFNFLGLKKLITTCYAGSPVAGQQLSLFDVTTIAPQSDNKRPYKVEITHVPDADKSGAVDLTDVQHLLKYGQNTLSLLSGDGDFRSQECVELLKQSDIVCTNPPFSLFREFVDLLVEHNKKFIIIGNKNAIAYKNVFALIKNGKMFVGFRPMSTLFYFVVPNTEDFDMTREGVPLKSVPAIWFTNLDIPKHHEDIILYRKYDPATYPTYDNYDAIEVSKVADIPMDYAGVMGVPITFVDKYNPNQFEVLGICSSARYNAQSVGIPFLGQKDARPLINNKNTYARIFIRNRRLQERG